MNSTSQYSKNYMANHNLFYPSRLHGKSHIFLIKLDIYFNTTCGMIFEIAMLGRRNVHRVEWIYLITGGMMKIEASNLQQTIKRGIGLYFVLALIALPSGICSHQHFLSDLEISSLNQLIAVYHTPTADEIEARQLPPDAGEQPVEQAAAPEEDLKPKEKLPPFHDHIMQAARNYDVDPALIRAIILAESSFNPRAVSKRGAQGLMQLMPITARSLGVTDSFDPALNIDGGVRYFRQLLDRFGDESLALAAYNAGSRYVREYQGVPPFQATRIYIKKVLQYREEFIRKTAAIDFIASNT